MKHRILLSFLGLFIFHFANGQNPSSQKFNLGFENKEENQSLPTGWFDWGTYNLSIDSSSYKGNYAAKIESCEEGQFGSIAYRISAKYSGTKIRIEAYMKTKDVKNGYAGLILRINDNDDLLIFRNMQNQNISGTNDWQLYSITAEYPDNAEFIYVAGALTGEGIAYFDEFKVTIDGNNLQTLKETPPPSYPADKDKEFAQGSGLESIELDSAKITDLILLGKIWGFLKYHHPTIASGEQNWDYELFRFLPEYLAIESHVERDEVLLNWIENIGEVKECKDCSTQNERTIISPDISWIDNTGISRILHEKLQYIKQNRNQGNNYYISTAQGVGNPQFIHENSYMKHPYPDAGFRLLSVFRYWNMIQYFFPYKHLMDKDWANTLEEYIPMFINAKNELAYEQSAIQLIGDIQDTHANLWGGGNKIEEWKGKYQPPVSVRFIENQLVVTEYRNPDLIEINGIAIGDIITKINGKSIEEILTNISSFYPASNHPTRMRDISKNILRSNAKEIEVHYSRAGKEGVRLLRLYPRPQVTNRKSLYAKHGPSHKMMKNNIGYITLASIKAEDIPIIKEAYKNTKGIIIDIRNYPSTFVPFSLGSYFVSEDTPFVKFSKGNVGNPGEFSFTDDLIIPKSDQTYQGKLIVIVNEVSQSQAEYTAMAFRAGDNTTIIGSTTAGADGNVSKINLPGGLRSMISGIGVYYPNGEETQRVGIVPDIEVHPTIEGIKAGRDELLEKAIELIQNSN